jgi:hypothetical protein
MTVVPAQAQALKHFSGAAIALALALWGSGVSARLVRLRVNDWKPGPSARGWTSLWRWARAAAAGELFGGLGLRDVTGGPQQKAVRVGQALRGWCPTWARELPPEAQAFLGSRHVA